MQSSFLYDIIMETFGGGIMKKGLIAVICVVSVLVGYMFGVRSSEERYARESQQMTNTYISFSIGELEDLKKGYDEDTMEALISNIYAAKSKTPNPSLNSALHDLWNALIFDGENIVGREDELKKLLEDKDSKAIADFAMSMRTIYDKDGE